MKFLKPLVMMQLKDKIDFSFLKSRKKTITKIVFTILGFVAVTAVCYLMFYISSLLNLFSLLPTVPLTVMVVIFTLMFILSCFTCTIGLMKKLYFSPDNQVLLTFPVKSNMIFVSKLIVFYIYELIKNFYFMIPVFLAYGIFCNFSLLFYPWLLFCFFFISLLPVLIGSLLSIPALFVSIWLKKTPIIKTTLFLAIIGAVIFFVIKLITLIPENINLTENWKTIFWDVQNFLNGFSQAMLPFKWLVDLLCGQLVNLKYVLFNINSLFVLLGLVASACVLFGISFFAAKPLFFKMASKPFEYKKKIITRQYKNKFLAVFRSGVKTNTTMTSRTSEYLYNYIGVLFVLPIAILFLNKVFNAMNTKLLGVYMTYSFNILLILLILLSSNVLIASICSKEGRSAYYFKTSPQKHIKILTPKLVFSLVLSFASTLAAVVIFGIFAKIGVINSIVCAVFIYSLYVGHLFWSAELDVMNPQNEQYATSGNQENNPNERKSSLFAFIIAFLGFGISLLLFNENIFVAWIKLMGIGLLFAVARIYLYIQRIKIYYKEK